MELERIIYAQGFGTRKTCRTLIRAGRVEVEGTVCTDPFQVFDIKSEDGKKGLVFSVDNEKWHYRKNAYIVLNKPKGYECSHAPIHHPSVFTLFPPPLINRGLRCVGRLDQDTTGILLFSDDGQFIHKWSSGKKRIPKCYQIRTTDPVNDETVRKLKEGVVLKGETVPVSAFDCSRKGEYSLEMIILEGKYHQVKRMLVAAGNNVDALHRKSIGGFSIDDCLPEGKWLWLEETDFNRLEDYASAI